MPPEQAPLGPLARIDIWFFQTFLLSSNALNLMPRVKHVWQPLHSRHVLCFCKRHSTLKVPASAPRIFSESRSLRWWTVIPFQHALVSLTESKKKICWAWVWKPTAVHSNFCGEPLTMASLGICAPSYSQLPGLCKLMKRIEITAYLLMEFKLAALCTRFSEVPSNSQNHFEVRTSSF